MPPPNTPGAQAVPASLQDVLDKVRSRATQTGVLIGDLRSQISTSMSQADVDTVVTTLAQIEQDMAAFGVDPANPVPVAPLPQARRR